MAAESAIWLHVAATGSAVCREHCHERQPGLEVAVLLVRFGGEPGGGELVDHHRAYVVGCLGALLAVVRHDDHQLCGRMTTMVAAT